MKPIEQIEMMEHCLRQIRRNPYGIKGLEHYVFLKLLEKCPEPEYKRIMEDYAYITKEE